METQSARREAVRNDWRAYPTERRRTGVSRKDRQRTLEAKPTCYVCKRAPSTEVDHVVPKCLGGSDGRHNLAGICRPCHLTKSAAEANFVRWHVKRIPHRKQTEADNG